MKTIAEMAKTWAGGDLKKHARFWSDNAILLGTSGAGGVGMQLLREFADFDPYEQTDLDIRPRCQYCNQDDEHEHESDCIYAKAKAFLAELDARARAID